MGRREAPTRDPSPEFPSREPPVTRAASDQPRAAPESMDLTLPQRLQQSVQGSFHKTALLQKRVRELIRGAAPLIETREQNPITIAFLEMERGLIELIPDEDHSPPPSV